ncbi:MAG: hypothetical protein KatS3mg111_3525 [Pirellulaceae bacterium]|nr:MAG: hypothetical protein KatS3mg111_3525 [Pirellulaceae bacterium]
MTLGGILILVLILISLIAFGYFVAVSAKRWGVLHTILLSVLFIEAWVFVFFAAGVETTRVRFTQEAFKNKELAETAEARTQQLLYGNFDVTSLNLEAVIPAKGMLERTTADRGRVWRGVNFIQAAGNGYQLELTAEEPAAEELVDPTAEAAPAQPAAEASESLLPDTVLYAFGEEVNEEGIPIPKVYLGEFRVTQSQGGLVQLEPTLPLRASQTQAINSGAYPTWTLYELLPLDKHEVFAAPGSQPTEEAIFGRMDEETIRQLFAGIADETRREQIIQSYLRDGQRATEQDPPEVVWVQVNILKNHEVEVDSQEVANANERGYFDSTGRAIDVRLKRSEKGEKGTVTLTPEMNDEIIVLKAEAAQRLIDSGVAELVQRIYVRPLNAYLEAFKELQIRETEVDQTTRLVQAESQDIQDALQHAQQQIAFRQVESQKLTHDLNGYQQEIAVLEQEVQEAEQQTTSLKSRISQLYRTIQAYRKQLESLVGQP